jgi:hypothetical protein
MSVLDGNLAALAPRFGDLARRLEEPSVERADIEVVPSASGAPTARYRGTWLHSRHDPRKEAAGQIARELDREATTGIALGFGLGYAAEEFLARAPGAALLVVEPDLALFRAALACRDLTAFLSSPRVTLHVGAVAEEIPEALGRLPLEKPVFLRLRAEVEKDPAPFRSAEEIARSYLLRREVNVNTLNRFGRLWVRNLCRNISAFVDSPGIARLEGHFTGVPALVLAGGPTFDAVAPRLRELAERMLVIAVNTPLAACREAGVSPDFTVVVDPQYWASRTLDWARPASGFVVAEPSTHPRVFRGDQSRFLLCSSLFPLGERLEAAVGERGKLGAGGSVSTSAWDLARLLGCEPIYAAGLDLGFPGLRTHCRNAFFEQLWYATCGRLSPVEGRQTRSLREIGVFAVRSAGGGWVATDRRMLLYKWWFENALAMRPGLRSYLLTGEGAAIAGMPVASIECVLALPRIRPLIDGKMAGVAARCRGSADKAENQDPKERRDALVGVLGALAADLRELERVAGDGLARTDRLESVLARREDPRKLLSALDEIDRRILEVSSRNVASFLLQSVIHRVQGAGDRAASAAEVLSTSREIYRGILESARFQGELLQRSVQMLSPRGEA